MSNLKYLNETQLLEAKRECEGLISYREETLQQQKRNMGRLQGRINEQLTRLEWIEHYLRELKPQRMTVKEIEDKLGHGVVVVADKTGV